ncbi:MAG: hypothetical protein IJZ15_04270 [Oscillospiraceae bacterium]|nr:hypothetical protein [Oscillospiraceae bacterium]
MENWIADVVGKMHIHKISQSELADYYGCSREFMNRVLNGAIVPPKGAKERILTAIDDLIARK